MEKRLGRTGAALLAFLCSCASQPVPVLDCDEVRMGEAFDANLRLAQRGDIEGLFMVGDQLRCGPGPRNEAAGREYLQAAARQGDQRARRDLRRLDRRNDELLEPESPNFDFERVREEASSGDTESMLLLAEALKVRSLVSEADYWHLVEEAAEAGSETAKWRLAQHPAECPAGIAWLKRLASAGDWFAQLQLGEAYAAGKGVEVDDAQALRWCLAAVEQDSGAAMLDAGKLYLKRNSRPSDRTEAFRLLRAGLESSSANADWMEILGRALVEHGQSAAERAEGIAWLRRGALAGAGGYLRRRYLSADEKSPESLLRRGECFDTILTEEYQGRDRDVALRWYAAAANLGSSEAEYKVGRILFLRATNRGSDLGDTRRRAIEHFERAAMAGHVPAQCALGLAYTRWWREEHEVVAPNASRSANWLRKAAEAGYQPAEWALGRCYENGYGVWKSKTKALHWYARASRNRVGVDTREPDYLINLDPRRDALTGIGRLTTDGSESGDRLRWGIASLRVAYYYYWSGDSAAECAYLFGELYRVGRGVPESEAVAIGWYREAADRYWAPAEARLRELESSP